MGWLCEHGHTKEAHPECYKKFLDRSKNSAKVTDFMSRPIPEHKESSKPEEQLRNGEPRFYLLLEKTNGSGFYNFLLTSSEINEFWKWYNEEVKK